MRVRQSRRADRDISGILRDTLRDFGPMQVRSYAAIIEKGIAMIAENPSRPAILHRSDILPGIRSFHLEHAAGHRHGAPHKVFFIRKTAADNVPELVILRVLHETMEPKRLLLQELRTEGHEPE